MEININDKSEQDSGIDWPLSSKCSIAPKQQIESMLGIQFVPQEHATVDGVSAAKLVDQKNTSIVYVMGTFHTHANDFSC
ncbi:hypothetical protein FRX31_017336 [Thalictrum thalictroides]|uniref:Uncharacterized protein n=1 Tax=Thalictrum thalictroides TaxID=46969 RepID=A0A7J6W9K9_THATH|nr:hypothetical protein FRX31_017336 [Thalictrum thalictroides]